jgi:hypothetical protein
MIDLSKFVNKQVRVTLMNGFKVEGKITFDLNYTTSPYLFSYFVDDMYCGRYYDKNGTHTPTEQSDIIQIEEIKPMSKYEELENKVAEMQKEIDRLKGEEEKNCLNLKPVEITRTVKITPEEYYEYCKEYKEKPTATGYVKYYSSSAWFMDSGDYTETFKVNGE